MLSVMGDAELLRDCSRRRGRTCCSRHACCACRDLHATCSLDRRPSMNRVILGENLPTPMRDAEKLLVHMGLCFGRRHLPYLLLIFANCLTFREKNYASSMIIWNLDFFSLFSLTTHGLHGWYLRPSTWSTLTNLGMVHSLLDIFSEISRFLVVIVSSVEELRSCRLHTHRYAIFLLFCKPPLAVRSALPCPRCPAASPFGIFRFKKTETDTRVPRVRAAGYGQARWGVASKCIHQLLDHARVSASAYKCTKLQPSHWCGLVHVSASSTVDKIGASTSAS
ncbi:uncharacterized protein V1518DRAFT_409825 [Limtongia smithiae]|uniref:uncharacterized protein n=1 Tax=Limtongia smithiae TaxID=1125753 RepID=UPI0034CED54F